MKGVGALLLARAHRHGVGQHDFALERLHHVAGDAVGAAEFVRILIKGAGDEDGVERLAIRGGENLRRDDVRPRGGAGACEDGEQARVIDRKDGEFGHAVEGIGRGGGDETFALLVGAGKVAGMLFLPLGSTFSQ